MSGIWPTPAQEILLHACLSPNAEAAGALDQLYGIPLDAGTAQLLPLLYRRWPDRQDPILLTGKKAYLTTWQQNRERLRALELLLAAFRQQHIPCVLLKGVAMILRYYKDPGLRSMRDFDLLVHSEHLEQATRHLAAMGYQPDQNLTTAQILARVRTGHAWQFSLGRQSCDLHWRPVVRCFAPEVTDLFWAGAEPAQVWAGAEPAQVLCPTDQLFQVCIHALQWDWVPQIRWIADALTILREPIDWDRVVHLAEAASMQFRLVHALDYLRTTFQAPIPATLNLAAPPWQRHEYDLLLKSCPLGFRDSFAWHRLHFRRIRPFDAQWSHTPPVLAFPQYIRHFLGAGGLRQLWRETRLRFSRT